VRPQTLQSYFETEEEEAKFDQADFDAAIPDYYFQ
jgi:hypothetical protein